MELGVLVFTQPFFQNSLLFEEQTLFGFSQTAEIILPPQFPNDPPVLK